MSTGNVHLIVTCTRRKTVSAGETVFPDERDAGRAYRIWMEKLAQARRGSPPMTAGELYTGQHWSRAAAAAAAARHGAEMWVISAGLGLLHVSDPVIPYEATFSSMPFCSRRMWSLLTSSPPTERRCASLQALKQERPHDRFIVAASPVYLKAVEADLCAGRGNLASPAQLTVVTSEGYRGCLASSITRTSAEMMKALNTNMTGLNISYAVQLLEIESDKGSRRGPLGIRKLSYVKFFKLNGQFRPIERKPLTVRDVRTGRLSVYGFAYFLTERRHGVRNHLISLTETL